MGAVYGNVKVNYSYCKSVAQLKSADDYILGRRKEQIVKYSRYKQKEILAQKLSISFHPDDNDKLTYASDV